jgi:hypothetical protein
MFDIGGDLATGTIPPMSHAPRLALIALDSL